MNHLSPVEIEALVIDPQALPTKEWREHLATCPDCARRLAEEARLELALQGLVLHDDAAAGPLGVRARQVAQTRMPAPWWRVALTAAAMLALVTAGVALLAPMRGRAPELAAALDADTPCLRDPIALSPGYAVHPPPPPGADAETTARGRMDWSGQPASHAATRGAP